MTDARLVRAQKLFALRERELEANKNNLALAVVATLNAKQAAEAGERAWLEAVDTPGKDLATLSDHEDHHQHLHLLRAAAERLARAFEEARLKEDHVRLAVAHATKELKKVELWHQSILDSVNEDERRKDMKANDELAARRDRDRHQEQ
jgi:predicted glycoside hydrolase/deacetylase ChbG (UPF0249 family)